MTVERTAEIRELTGGSDSAASENDAKTSTALWTVVIFLSAFLLFQVQPIIAKIILPWFGGAAGVWTTSLMFFQVTYLLGNLYAHWLASRENQGIQSRLHAALLAASLFVLPIFPKEFWKPTGAGDPTVRILGLLAATIGLPFLLLSATSPLLQAWYTRARREARPYWLYALSNAGSLLALLSYPVLIESFFSTRHQAISWSVTYAIFAILCATVALRHRDEIALPKKIEVSAKPDWKLQLLWVALAADASAFLLAVTNHLSQNVAAVPLLWVLPLSLYLLSLILCFEGRNWYRRFLFLRLLAVALGGMAYALSPDFVNAGLKLLAPLFCGGLFIACMVCHGELAKLKPSPEYLTNFYLMVALGGATGGVFVGVIAPHVFSGFYELPIAIAGCAILVRIVLRRDPSTVFYKGGLRPASLILLGLMGLLVISLFVVTRRQGAGARMVARNFYGGLRVTDFGGVNGEPRKRKLINGNIIHGIEFLSVGQRREPTTYYGPRSGAGLALLSAQRKAVVRAGFIGLGAGTLASYGRKGDRFFFYEINPLVIQVAQTEFDFLRDSDARVEIIPGDARLSLEREAPQGLDVLVVDAFSGDAIPVHLLTREAFLLYFRHLGPQGILAIHVSNKFVDLKPVVWAATASLGKEALLIHDEGDEKREIYRSTWMLMSNAPEGITDEKILFESIPIEKERKVRLWTDDFSNVFGVLK